MQNVGEPSPPRTPAQRSASMERSPVNFSNVAWDERSTHMDIVAYICNTDPSDRAGYDSRRPSVVDPALPSTYNSPRGSLPPAMQPPVLPPVSNHHHRPSLPYPPPPPPNASVHTRHQSSPVPQGHATYHPQQVPAMMAPAPYSQPVVHHGSHFEH